MPDNNPQPSQLDLLHKVETLTSHIDQMMQKRGQSVLRRYPLTFALLVLFGAAAVGEGVKGMLELMGFADHPIWMFFAGIVILVVTGTLYKKLDK